MSFTTEAGEGFGTGQITLRRRYDGEYLDLGLLNNVVIEGCDGQIAYEGRVQGTPRALDASGSQVRMDLAGWMSHARQRQFTELIIDRDLSQWGPMDSRYKARAPGSFGQKVLDPSGDSVSNTVAFTYDEFTDSHTEAGFALYAAPGPLIHRLVVKQVSRPNDAWWSTTGYIYKDSQGLEYGVTASKTDAADVVVTADGLRFAYLSLSYTNNAVGSYPQTHLFYPVVFGPIWAGQSPNTEAVVALTDAMRYLLGRYAPKIDTSQIRNNNYPVKHAVWREPTNAHEAVKDLNAHSQWALGVYEDRRLEYRPFDLSKYDWQVRAGQDGVEIETPGVTVDDAFNGVVVSYTDWSGAQRVVTPDDAAELRDTNPAIAANQWGEQAWTALSLSNPVAQADAVGMASLYLAELNRPKFPSTITVPGHIRDRTGAWRQNWLPRANQTVSVMNHPNDQPRLITSTSWSGGKLTITTDNALNRWEAINTRLERARSAGGM